MPLVNGHGNGRGKIRPEVTRSDELPPPVPAPPAPPSAPLAFLDDGKIADSSTAKELGRRGGLARAQRVRLINTLGLAKVADDPTFAPYRAAGDEFVRAELAAIAEQSGGIVGPGPASIVVSAGLQLAAGRWMMDQGAATGNAELMTNGSALWNHSRQNLISARDLAGREALARKKAAPREDMRTRLLSATPARAS